VPHDASRIVVTAGDNLYAMMRAMPPLLLIEIAVAMVWVYEGLWCKVLRGSRHELEVVEAAPVFGPGVAALFLRALGVFECALAVWVLSGWQPLWAAVVQTALLVSLNTAGITWSRHLIPDPPGMLIKNFAFLVLVWVAAGQAVS
jgi:DoxX-like family